MGFEGTKLEQRIEVATHAPRIERQTVESVEKLPVPDNMKVDLLLICGGLKQATEMKAGKQWSPNEPTQSLSEEEIAQYKKALEEICLQTTEPIREKNEAREVTEGEDAPYVEYGKDIARFYIAKDILIAERLKEAGKTNDDRTYGELSGFPITAIEAYIGNERLPNGVPPLIISREELPDEVRRRDFMAFAEYMFSREHWKDEIETARHWSEEIKQVDPDLYVRMVSLYQTHARAVKNLDI